MFDWYIPLLGMIPLTIVLVTGYFIIILDNSSQVVDKYSAANFQSYESLHYNLDLTIDFEHETLSGKITHFFRSISTGVRRVILDARSLDITKVYNATSKEGLNYYIYSYDYIEDTKNEQLIIDLSPDFSYNDVFNITIEYSVKHDATAINWVPESQTFDKKYKFLYTQCEAIHCRSIAPLQDSPAVKSTFNATLRAKLPYIPLISAMKLRDYQDGEWVVYDYVQRIPVPSYLLALAAGNLAYKKVGPRTGVYAEPSKVDESAEELSELEDFLNTIEEVLIPYAWGVYNVLIMPPSFPYGGMENPYLTFVSPSIILGDKSSAYVAAHEICHSWFGNLVTNKNWTHFWLNEGFTQYSERLILRKNYNESRYKCQALIGIYILSDEVKDYLEQGRPECTKLSPNLYREGPDDIMSDIPYEKGFLFVTYLESLIGTNYFYGFLKKYVSTYAYKSIEVWEMKTLFETYVNATVPNGHNLLKEVDWDKWLFAPGMPDDIYMNFTNKEIETTLELVECYRKGGECNKEVYEKFILDQKVIFVQRIRDLVKDFDHDKLHKMEEDLGIAKVEKNPEVLAIWLEVMVLNRCFDVNAVAESFLTAYGRMKYIIPIYAAYAKVDKAHGKELFNRLRKNYHPIAEEQIRRLFE